MRRTSNCKITSHFLAQDPVVLHAVEQRVLSRQDGKLAVGRLATYLSMAY